MNVSASTVTTRSEETAFLVVEDVLGVDIVLADAGAGSAVPDGRWSKDHEDTVIEVTSFKAHTLMKRLAIDPAAMDAGSVPVHPTEVGIWLGDLFTKDLAKDWEKLRGAKGSKRHLYLLTRATGHSIVFTRLSDDDSPFDSIVRGLQLPDDIDCVWFEGRAVQLEGDRVRVFYARLDRVGSWSRGHVDIAESQLPSPKDDAHGPGVKDRRRTGD